MLEATAVAGTLEEEEEEDGRRKEARSMLTKVFNYNQSI